MNRKKASLILIIYLIVFLASLTPGVKGFTVSHIDPENDVFRIDVANQKIEKVSTHPQFDIISIALNVTPASQYVNVTFLGNITGFDMECNIYFFENYNPDNLVFEYGVHYSNLTGTGFKVIFVKYILNGDQYNFEFWNNTISDWTPSNSSASNIGTFSAYTIEATIPQLAFTVNESTTWFTLSTYYDGNYVYLDAAPDSFSPVSETNGGFGFEIFLIAGIIIVVIFVIYFYRKKKLNKPLY